MTNKQLIDHFAGLAMQGIITTKEGQHLLSKYDFSRIAKESYRISLAMIDERTDLLKKGFYDR